MSRFKGAASRVAWATASRSSFTSRCRSICCSTYGSTNSDSGVSGDIALRATARAAEPLLLIVDVTKPRPSDITVNVSSQSLRGEVLRILAGVDGEIRRFIAQYVADEIDAPQSQAAQVIDVMDRVNDAWP